jgi:hypothetical protein
MLVKHRLLETSYKGAMQARSCIMAKAGLLELQFPGSNRRGLRRLVEAQSESACEKILATLFLHVSQAEALSQRAVKLDKGTNGEPKLHGIALRILNVDSLSRNAHKGYGARASENPIWLRSLRSSLRTGKPSTWRRETGCSRTRELRRYA